MYIKIRPMSGGSETVFTVSKLTKVEELQQLIHDKLSVSPEQQRLFFQGKQLVAGHTMFDYNININDVIQMLVRPVLAEASNTSVASAEEEVASPKKEVEEEGPSSSQCNGDMEVPESLYYRTGDLVDARLDGSWWEAEVLRITRVRRDDKEGSQPPEGELTDDFVYHVRYERFPQEDPAPLRLWEVRPRAWQRVALGDVQTGDRLLVNYNIDSPTQRGHWYHAVVEGVVGEGRRRRVVVTVDGGGGDTLTGCVLAFPHELLAVPQHVLLTQRGAPAPAPPPPTREAAPSCGRCDDAPSARCRACGCAACGGKEAPHLLLLCDECDGAHHTYCLDPPLSAVPTGAHWYCPSCRRDDSEIVRAGEGLKAPKKGAKSTGTSRDWGRGYACVGRSRQCTVVPPDHFGHVPGVPVGASWLYRIQASEAGVHRPPVSGIHGRGDRGAYSLVLAGGYEDDVDGGDEVWYTGAGGRDLTGNRRTAPQSCDQTLTKSNRALAMNCNCPLSPDGGDAGEAWQGGRPIRVLRSYKGRRHSQYAPEEGIRYDGLYKVVRYVWETGRSGYRVWRYLLRRDDPEPAPWTDAGQRRARELGLKLQRPPDAPSPDGAHAPAKRKRNVDQDGSADAGAEKKTKSAAARLPADVTAAIAADTRNSRLWAACTAALGRLSVPEAVEEQFTCVCCQELLLAPVTTPCQHNVCSACLDRAFRAQVRTCPSCRKDLGPRTRLTVNEELSRALRLILPGYRGTQPPTPP